ncbi:L-aspartate oxidase [Labedella populi]|uniref:L-aspartate oxidase n=1 Tax=Labedella populi TaxID=2498850 RepID=A0A3S4ABE6_9MICO|nr:L-aspartate oxidase [Labedella populi]RWZ64690.1 L-aspartate oxidase [Labedella populi]
MARSVRRSVVVVGSGIAGLTTALRASRSHDVVLVTSGCLEDSNTRYAQGGIAGVLGTGDSVAAHVEDTIAAGAGLCDPEAVRVLATEAPGRLRELVALGVPFDRVDGALALALEAAHSAARILHAGGDATGAAIEATLASAARERVDRVLEHTRATALLLTDGIVSGVRLEGFDGPSVLAADAVVLATGGFAGLYAHTSNPPSATGAGLALAAWAGAAVADLEFVQFHPTVLAGSGGFLISEAVRGEGAVLRDGSGERFLLRVHAAAELAPRDVVARGIADAMARQGGRPVFLDATALDGPRLDARFPGIAARLRAAGIDWTREPVPVTPAAHYTMGGIATDLHGLTTVPGLLAVGEVARTGVHGANRLASNSLIEGAVFGARAATALGNPQLYDRSLRVPTGRTFAPMSSSLVTPTAFERGGSHRVADLLWEEVGLSRSAVGLERAVGRLDALARAGAAHPDDLLLAWLVAHAALDRRESRGAHSRVDFPATDPALTAPSYLRVAGGHDALVDHDDDRSRPATRPRERDTRETDTGETDTRETARDTDTEDAIAC